MILHSLTLRNFKGLLAGVGLPEVTIDFDKLPSGLIAVVGGNGMGKTTLLDNCHPYRLMPYKLRKSPGWSPSSFSYYDEVVGEAMKWLVFSVGGVRYKTVILIDADRRKQEATLYRWDTDSMFSALGSGWLPLNDGKTRTYDEEVEKVCGSPSLFFTSVFRAQGAKNLSDYTRGDIVSVVAELLNVDHIKEQGEKARKVAAVLQTRADGLRRDRAVLETSADAMALILRRDSVEEELSSFLGQLESCRTDLQSISDKKAELEMSAAAEGVTRQRIADKKAELVRAGATASQYPEILADLRAQLDSERARAAEDERRYGAVVADLTKRRAAAVDILSREAEIRKSSADLPGMKSALELALNGLQTARDSYAKARVELAEICAIEQRIASADHVLSSLRRRAAALDGLDCAGQGTGWVNDHCPLLRDAVAAKGEIPEAEDAIASLREKFAAKEAKEAEVKQLEETGKSLADNMKPLEADVAAATALAALLPQVNAAVSDAATVEAEIERVSIENLRAALEAKNRASDLDAKIAAATAGHNHEQEAKRVFVDRLAEEIRQLEASVGSGLAEELVELDKKSAAVRGAIATGEKAVADLQSEIGAIRAKIAEAEAAEKKLVGVDAAIASVNDELACWNLMAKACSNDGIVALEIDDAGPSIAAICNDLLRSCYGPRFSVRLETQSQKVNGDAKEDFDITVFDAETGEQKSITDMSGGQILWIEDSLVRAICLFNIQRSDRAFGTIYSDEKDGALDPARKVEFMAVKRRSLEVGGHTRELFITQTADLVDMADGVIRLEPGKVEAA